MTKTVAVNEMTGTTHYARRDSFGGLVQVCGIKANQRVYLQEMPAGTAVTCRKCPAAKPAAKPAPERKTFGRQEWTITDLRDVAKELGIAGRTRMTGDELLAEIVKRAPQFG